MLIYLCVYWIILLLWIVNGKLKTYWATKWILNTKLLSIWITCIVSCLDYTYIVFMSSILSNKWRLFSILCQGNGIWFNNNWKTDWVLWISTLSLMRCCLRKSICTPLWVYDALVVTQDTWILLLNSFLELICINMVDMRMLM